MSARFVTDDLHHRVLEFVAGGGGVRNQFLLDLPLLRNNLTVKPDCRSRHQRMLSIKYDRTVHMLESEECLYSYNKETN